MEQVVAPGLRPGPVDLPLPSTLRELQSPVHRGEGLRLQRLHLSQSDSILHVPGSGGVSLPWAPLL